MNDNDPESSESGSTLFSNEQIDEFPSIDEGAIFRDAQEPYPPNQIFNRYKFLTFTRFLIFAFLSIALIDFIRIDMSSTPIPYNYTFYVTLIHLPISFIMLERYHSLLEDVKCEIIDINSGESIESLFDLAAENNVDKIESDFERIVEKAFSPISISFGALIGAIAIIFLWTMLDLFTLYPHSLVIITLGSAHGLFLAPFIGTIILANKLSDEFIVDIDFLDPDGVGGYVTVGDSIVTLVIYGIVLMTFDFITISSVSFASRLGVQATLVTIYAIILLIMVVLALLPILLTRRRLIEIRDNKLALMRWQFRQAEKQFWEGHHKQSPNDSAAIQITAFSNMYRDLKNMNMWAIDLFALIKLSFSVGSSLLVIAIDQGWVPLTI